MSLPDGGPAQARLATRPATLTVAELAWVALIPCALVGTAAIVLLGPLLGDLLFSHSSDRLWPPRWWETVGQPEHTKHGRVIVAALAPAPLVLAILIGARRRLALLPIVVRGLSFAGQAAVVAVLAVALLEQRLTYTEAGELVQEQAPTTFGLGKVLVAAGLVALAVTALSRDSVRARLGALARETSARRRALLAIAIGVVAIWVLKAVVTDRLALGVLTRNLPWTLNDAIGVLDGRTPLVDYHPIYGKLLPYLCAPVLSIFGANALSYSTFLALLDAIVLLAVYAVFRRLTRSSVLGFSLLVPFLATSDYSLPIDFGVDRGLETSPLQLFGLWPMRYGGAYLLAWLTARHLDGSRPRHPAPLFFAGGLIAIDGLEFGAGAVGATVVALLCAQRPASARGLLRLAASAAAGLLAAGTVVALITVVRSGHLPDFELLLEWPRIFTSLGWFSMPLPTWGLHVAIYVTFIAAVAVAAVRAARHAEDVLLTSMLAWSGVFGLLVGGYVAGRPDPWKITGALSAWSFALSMLMIVCVRALAQQRWRPTVPQLLVLFGFALSLCSIVAISPPTEQIHRLRGSGSHADYLSQMEATIGERTRRGETVAVLIPMSFAVTHQLGLRNVAPYGLTNSIVTESQMTRLVRALRDEHVQKVFVAAPRSELLYEGDTAWDQLHVLEAIGFQSEQPVNGVVELRSS